MLDLRVGRLAEQLDEGRDALARQVRPGGATSRSEELRSVEDRGRAELLADGHEQHLLALHAAIVRVHVPAARVGEGLASIEMLLAGLDAELDRAPAGVRVPVVHEGLGNVDVDAAHRIDDTDHAHEVNDEDRIDGAARDLAHDRTHRADPLDRAFAGPETRVAGRGLDIHLVEEARLAPAGRCAPGGTLGIRGVLHVAGQSDHGGLRRS